ncbi:MAG: LPXTG cell wall anchor domain-containing protein, partial [Clostridia bacterium]|nr:LPXTG cell wall anchor domain-containing protein [Clostridia bacterium]
VYGDITKVSFALYAKEDMIATDETVIPKDGLIEISSCDENGNIVFNTDLPVGLKVYVKEFSTDKGYIISDEIYSVTFEYTGQDVAISEIIINEGNTIVNDIIRGMILGKKVDEDGFSIAGASFGLFREDETEFNTDTALIVSTSNEIGVFGFENVPYGNWIVRELQPAPAFVPNDTLYPITISENEQIIELTVENVFIVGSVQTTKVDKDYPENKLSGAVFEIYVDLDGNKEFNADIDKLVEEMSETEKGVYVMTNLRYNGYFLYEKTAPEGFIKDDRYYYFEISENNQSIIVENKAGVGFTNTARVGSLKLVKTSSDKKVEGFSFRVTGPNGYDKVFVTDKNGEILIENIRIGEYLVSEVSDEASKGYVLPDDKKAVVFEGAVTTVEMHNELIVHSDAPQTGDNSNLIMWAGLALVSGSSVGLIILHSRRKQKGK